MSVPEVTVHTRPRSRSYTDVPGELITHFQEQGKRLSWQREFELPMLYSEGIEPVNVTLLDADLRELLQRVRMQANQDGVFSRGTVVLCSQPIEDYEAAQAEYASVAATNQQRQDVDELDEMVREKLGLGIFHPPGSSYKPADFVSHTPAPRQKQKE